MYNLLKESIETNNNLEKNEIYIIMRYAEVLS